MPDAGRLRFCMITTFYPPHAFGGDAIFLHRLSNLLARHGHEVDVIHSVDSYRVLAGAPPTAGYPNAPGVTLHPLSSPLRGLSPFASHQTGYPVFTGRAIRRVLASKAFDVIHFHNVSLIGGPMVLSYGEGIKLYTMHEHWLICPTHVLFKFQREPCEKRACLRCVLSYGRPPQLWRYTRMLRKVLRHVDAFIAPSDFTRRRHLQSGLDIPIAHIPYFLDDPGEPPIDDAAVDALGLSNRPFFLFVGRLERLKGLQTVIPVFRSYRDADLVVAGDGSYAPELRALAAGCDRVHFLGQLSARQLSTLYRRTLGLIVPSLTFETFAQVIIEAHAARAPVIVRDLGPLPEIVAESGGGLVFRDTAGLIAAMERLRTDAELRGRLGAAGHGAYRARWTAEAHLDLYLGLINEVRARKEAVLPATEPREDPLVR